MSHPGIVAVHDVGMDNGQVYLVSIAPRRPRLGRWLGDHPYGCPERPNETNE